MKGSMPTQLRSFFCLSFRFRVDYRLRLWLPGSHMESLILRESSEVNVNPQHLNRVHRLIRYDSLTAIWGHGVGRARPGAKK